MKSLYQLPTDLPVPVDDGACNHLAGTRIPSLLLDSVSGEKIDIGKIQGTLVLFFYPMNGQPEAPPGQGWNEIPGARGCTPQVCSFKDSHVELLNLGVKVFGVSSQPIQEQKEASARLQLPFELLNDSKFILTKELKLPTFKFESDEYIKRVSIIVKDGLIKKVFYPVFPPDRNVHDVIDWIKKNKI